MFCVEKISPENKSLVTSLKSGNLSFKTALTSSIWIVWLPKPAEKLVKNFVNSFGDKIAQPVKKSIIL